MSSRDDNTKSTSVKRGKMARQFRRATAIAPWVDMAEQAWNRAVPTVGGLACLFVTATSLGLWQHANQAVKTGGLALCAVALGAAVLPLFKIRRPDRKQILRRIDEATGPGRPASTYADMPLGGNQEAAFMQAERERIENTVGKFRTGFPRSQLGKHYPLPLRAGFVLAAGLSVALAGWQGELEPRLAALGDFAIETPERGPVLVEGWVEPPSYTKKPAFAVASVENPQAQSGRVFDAPSRSVLKLNVHEHNTRIFAEGGITNAENACTPVGNGESKQCSFVLFSDARVLVQRGADEPLSWQFEVNSDMPPRVTVRSVGQDAATGREQGAQINVVVDVEDEYGAVAPELELELKRPENPDAKPLPIYNLDRLRIPAR